HAVGQINQLADEFVVGYDELFQDVAAVGDVFSRLVDFGRAGIVFVDQIVGLLLVLGGLFETRDLGHLLVETADLVLGGIDVLFDLAAFFGARFDLSLGLADRAQVVGQLDVGIQQVGRTDLGQAFGFEQFVGGGARSGGGGETYKGDDAAGD